MSWWDKFWLDESRAPLRTVVKQTTKRYVLTSKDDFVLWTYVLSCGHKVELNHNPFSGGPKQIRCQECKDLLSGNEPPKEKVE
jgi:hypothetical protein